MQVTVIPFPENSEPEPEKTPQPNLFGLFPVDIFAALVDSFDDEMTVRDTLEEFLDMSMKKAIKELLPREFFK